MKACWKTFLGVSLCAAMTGGIHAAPARGSSTGSAPDFPSKPVRIVIGFSPGGLPDIMARVIAQKLAESWTQPVVVENRPGAGGIVASQIVAGSAPDGYTMLAVTSAHAATPALYAKLPFDAVRDFAGVTTMGTNAMLLVASSSLGVKSVKDLIALARARPGQLNFSSAGVGSNTHFAMEIFKSMAGIDIVHVPYKGIPEALTETMAGRVQLFMAPLGLALPQVKDGKVQALGVTTTRRSSLLPDVPTVAESGLPAYRWVAWLGLLVPAKTPRAIIDRLNGEITRILSQPDVHQRWATLGVDVARSTPEQFDKIIRDEIVTFTKAARAANIKAE